MYQHTKFVLALNCAIVLMCEATSCANEPKSLVHTETAMSLADVIKIIHEDTNNHIVLDKGLSDVTVEPISEQPFWSTLNQICRDHELSWSWKNRRTIEVGPGPTRFNAMVCDQGVRVALRQVASSSKLTRIQFQIDVEPRWYPFFLEFHEEHFSLKNSEKTWHVLSPDAKREIFFVNENHAEFTIDYVGRPKQGTVAEVAGEFALTLPTEHVEQVWNVNEDMNETKLTKSHKVQLFTQALMPDDDELKPYLEFIVTMPDEILRTFASHRLGLLHQDVALQSGEESDWIRPDVVDIVRTQRNSQQVRYLFPPMGLTSAARVRYGVPEKIKSIPIKFSIDLQFNSTEDDDETQD